MSLYSVLKKTWHAIMPYKVRLAIFNMTPAPLRGVKRRMVARLEKGAEHNEIYDAEYYAQLVDPTMQMSAKSMAASIVDTFHPRTVIDVGCGTGVLMVELQSRGVKCTGLEYSEAAIATSRKRGLDVVQFDIEKDPPPKGLRADLVISTEVAEHLPESCADRFLDLLISLGDQLVLTAAEATSAHSSTDHVNEQPRSYWIAKMQQRGYTHDETLSDAWRNAWRDAGVAHCFYHSVMVYRKAAAARPRERGAVAGAGC